MASTIDSGQSGRYVDFDEYIDYQLSKTRRTIKAVDVLTTLAGVGALLLGYLLVFTMFDHWVVEGGFSRTTRMVMLTLVVLASIAWVVWTIVLPWWKQVTSLYAARMIEETAPELRGSLLNLVDLRRSGKPPNPGIRRALEKRSAQELSEIDVDHAVDRRTLLNLSYTLLAMVTICCLYAYFSPKPISFLRPLTAADVPVATQTIIVNVEPGNADVTLGDSVPVTVQITTAAQTALPKDVHFHYSTADGSFVDERLDLTQDSEDPKTFHLLFSGENGEGLTQTVTYYVTAGDARSETYKLAVVVAPTANVTQVDYIYPEYMAFEPQTRFTAGIDAWEGTQVVVHAESPHVPVASAVLQLLDANETGRPEEVRVKITGGTKLEATWTLALRPDGSHPTRYRFLCTAENGAVERIPAEHPLKIRPDEAPIAELLDPTGDLRVPANAIVPLLYKARDPDFAISQISLLIERDGQETREPLFNGSQPVVMEKYRWQLSPLGLTAGEELTFRIEARDNRQPKHNVALTPPLRLRVVAPAPQQQVEEQAKQAEAQQDDILRNEKGAGGDESQEQQGGGEGKDENNKKGGGTGEDDESGGKNGTGEDSKEPSDNDEGSGENRQESGEGGEQPQPSGKNDETGDEPQTGEQGGGEQPKPLADDGTDDDEALEKILEHQQNEQGESEASQNGNESDSEEGGGGSRNDDGNEPSSDEAEKDPNGGGKGQSPSKDNEDGPASSQQQGPGNKPSDDTENKSDSGEGKDGTKDGPREPADDSKGPAEKRPGDPNTTGTGRPGDESDENAPKANDPKNLKPQPGAKPTPTPSPSQDERPPTAPEANDLDRRRGADDPMNPRKQTGDAKQPPGPDEPSRGEGNKDAQKSRRPDYGEDGSSSQNSEGTPGDKGKGDADPSGAPGETEQNPDGREGGAPGNKAGKGSTTSPSDDGSKAGGTGEKATDKPGAAANQAEQSSGAEQPSASGEEGSEPAGKQDGGAKGEGGEGEKGTKGAGESGEGGGKKGDSDQEGAKQPGGSGQGGGPGGTVTGGKGSQAAGGDLKQTPAGGRKSPNLDNAKQAADLVLKKLENDLERGEVDEKLLKELGWTEEQMRAFADRMRRQLEAERNELTPEEQIKQRQFEEMLKSIDFDNRGAERSGAGQPIRPVQGIGRGKRTPPLEYKPAFEQFLREVGRQKKRPAP